MLRGLATACLSLLIVLAGCQPKAAETASGKAKGAKDENDSDANGACFAVVNGQRTSGYPAVRMLVRDEDDKALGSCTGTFVSHNTLLTAAHCLGDENEPLLLLPAQAIYDLGTSAADQKATLDSGLEPLKILTGAASLGNGGGHNTISTADTPRDLAILIFPDNTSSATMPLAKASRRLGDEVKLVGYGIVSVDGQSTIKRAKREGRNVLVAPKGMTLPPGSYALTGRGDTASAGKMSDDSLAAQGDSGGPLLSGNVVIGVASAGIMAAEGDMEDLFEGDAVNFYADVTGARAKKLFTQAREDGAVFTYEGEAGATSADESTCD